jgi:hypothetical protein
LIAAGTGAVGGAFGVTALPVELLLSTMMMLRFIADVARSRESGSTRWMRSLHVSKYLPSVVHPRRTMRASWGISEFARPLPPRSPMRRGISR